MYIIHRICSQKPIKILDTIENKLLNCPDVIYYDIYPKIQHKYQTYTDFCS